LVALDSDHLRKENAMVVCITHLLFCECWKFREAGTQSCWL